MKKNNEEVKKVKNNNNEEVKEVKNNKKMKEVKVKNRWYKEVNEEVNVKNRWYEVGVRVIWGGGDGGEGEDEK